MVPTPCPGRSTVLRKPLPERCFGASFECMCADPDDAGTRAGIAPALAVLLKKIYAALGPFHLARTFSQFSRAANSLGQHIKDFVEADQSRS